MIIRNDDVAADTTLHEIQTFCELCDKYGVTPIHAITPIGNVQPIDASMDNATIRRVSGTALFSENREVVEYLQARQSDLFGVHGLWHTHRPSSSEVTAAGHLIIDALKDALECELSYYIPPFNEGEDEGIINIDDCCGLAAYCGAGIPRLEEYLEAGDPQAATVYLHSWRFEHGPFTWDQLDKCLKRLTAQ